MEKAKNPERRVVKVTLLAAGVMVILGGAAMAPALPSIRDYFSSIENIDYLSRFVLTLPALMIALTATVAGYFVDRIGRMKILISSLALAGVAGTSGYLATSLNQVLIGRALVGIAVAGIMTSSTTLIADYYVGEERGKLLGLQTGFMGLGGTVLLMMTGILADSAWNTPFLIHLAALAVLPFVVIFLFEPRRDDRCQGDHPPVGEPGACAGESELRSGEAAQLAPASVAVPYKLLAFIYLMIIFIQVNFYIVPLHLPFYLGELVGASATQSGVAISFMSLSFSLSSIFLGKALARRDRVSVMLVSFVILSAGYSLISLGAASIFLYLGLVLGGIGLGVMVPSLYVWLANETPVAIRGRVLGGFTTATFLGQFLSPILSQPLINAFDIGRTMLITSVVFLAIVPFLFVGRKRLRSLATPA